MTGNHLFLRTTDQYGASRGSYPRSKAHRARTVVLCVAFVVLPVRLFGQGEFVRLEGSLSASSEFYSISGIDPRRPGTTHMAILSPTLVIGDQIRLPFSAYISNTDRGYRQPFNQFGVSPQFWGWLTLHAGYYSAKLSDLTFGDTRLLGGGIEARPGNFRISALYGRAQQSIAADTVQRFRGVYERRIMAAKLGYGNEEKVFVDFNLTRAWDDSGSLMLPRRGIASDSVANLYDVAPQENIVLSTAFGLSIADNLLKITGEAAVSGNSQDTRGAEIPDVPGIVSTFFTPRYSSRADAAGQLAIGITPSQSFAVRLTSRWIGPGFVTLGYPYMPNDLFEWTVAPAFRFFAGRLSLRGSLGLRTNNLRSTLRAPTNRTIGMANASAQITDLFGLDAQYANYGMRSAPRNDTLRIDNISQSLSVSPRVSFQGMGGTNSGVVTLSYQDFTDLNVITGGLNGTVTRSAVAVYSLAFPSSLSVTATALYADTRTALMNSIIQSLSGTLGYAFFENRLSTSATVGYSGITVAETDNQITFRLSASYSAGAAGTFTVAVYSNAFSYANEVATPSYRERQASVQYSVTF